MSKFLKRGYIKIIPKTEVSNLTHYFTVPKGDNDVRMVFNRTKSGLTDVLWAPSFWLPNAVSMLRTLSFGHRMVDIDLGEHFLNHPIHDKLIKLSAVDLTPFKEHIKNELPALLKSQDLSKNHVFGAWTRAWMGAKSSPEWAVRFFT